MLTGMAAWRPTKHLLQSVAVVVGLLWLSASALGQTPTPTPTATPTPAPTPKVWTLSASAGLAFTQGNTDTSSTNLGYSIVYDPHTKNVVKSDLLFLRSRSQGELTSNRVALSGRDDYKLTDRGYFFGQVQYLRDQFKGIEYVVAPTVGLGYKLIARPNTELSADGGVGVSWEKDTGLNLVTSGALTASDKFVQKLSPTSTFTQTFSALWKTKDLGDALYVTGLSLAAAINTHTQLKVDWLDTYKHKPPANLKRNDMALVLALVLKN